MGKQSRRTHRNKKGTNQSNNTKSYDKSSKTDDSSSSTGTGSTNLINRIRHGDARVRHGALAALSSTILSSESLIASSAASSSGRNKSSGGNKQIINMELIQAICERVMDDDMPCAICAAGCLGNYILFGLYDNHNDNATAGGGKNRIDGTAVETLLTPILLSRMNKIGDAIYSITQTTLAASTDDTSTTTATTTTTTNDASSNDNNNNNNKKKNKNKNKPATASTTKAEKLVLSMMEQWSLASLTLRALCGLVEGTSTSSTNDTDNGVSPSSSILFHHRTSFLEVCPRLFNLGSETLKIIAASSSSSTTTTTAGGSTSTTKMLADDEIENGTISDAVIYAARTLHASCDENPALVSSLASLSTPTPTPTPSMNSTTTSPNTNNNSNSTTWDTIVSSVQNDTLPPLARLHCAGIVTIARHLLTTTDTIPSSSVSADRLDATFTSMIIPYLHHSFATTPLLLPQHQHPNTNTTVPTTTTTTKTTTQITNLSNAIHKAELGLQKEANDEQIERQIIRESAIRKESARSIARRQKILKRDKIAAAKLKKEEEAEEKRNEGGDAAMEEDGDGDGDGDGTTPVDDVGEGSTKEEEANERYDRAVTVWNDACLPLKLSLEIVTNLCAAVGAGLDDSPNTAGDYYGNDNEEDDGAMNMDTEMAWDSDREEKLMAEVQQEQRQQEKKEQFPTTDTTQKQRRLERQQVVTSSGVPDRVLDVFGTILMFLLSPPATPTPAFDPNTTKLTMADEIDDTSSTNTGHPEVVTQDLIEILSKCGTCLGNVLGNLSDWKRTDVEVAPIFKDLIASLKEISARQPHPSIGGMAPSAYFGVIATLSSTMAAFLQFRPVLMGCVLTDELDLILSCALIQEHQPPQPAAAGAGATTGNSNSNDNDNDADDKMTTAILISDIQKDAISMLGMLSSQPHPHEVNAKMCTALVALLTRSTPSTSATSSSSPPTTTASVMNEVLNVLMDMYSADAGDPNNHEDVFQAMGVRGVFQRCAPIFKRMIREEKMSRNNSTFSSSSSSMEDITMWNETALNVTRFVRYKNGR